MRPRYLLIAGARPGQAALQDRLSRAGLELAFDQPLLAAFTNGQCRCLSVGEEGCVLGTLFHRHGRASRVDLFDPAEAAAIAKSRGDKLLTAFWGGYIAAVAASNRVRILRDPSAALPCYFALGTDFAAFASDVELLIEAGFAGIDIEWDALARQLFGAGVPTPETALRGIWELMPGFAAEFHSGLESQRPCWSPWDYVHGRTEDTDLAAERLERTVAHCVRAWASGHGHLLLSASGGLDSSIVAAGLADSGAKTTCLNMYGSDPGADERTYARALAAHLNLPLIERAYRIEDIDIAAPLGSHLPRTKDRTQALAYERVHLDVAGQIGATAFVTGNGGDSVFGYSQSAAALADRYLVEGTGPGLYRTLRDICLQTGCGPFDAAASAWRLARGPRRYQCRPDALFLHPDLVASLGGSRLDHPWLEGPEDALPGKAAHIASILRVQQSLEPSRGRVLSALNPLLSQPIIECCLSVPSWQWREGGRDRALARRAFASALPPAILRRRVKGGPDGFAAQILDQFRVRIRERLLEGHLARQQIVDRKALEQTLLSEHPSLGTERVRILELVAAEAWLDSWLSRAATGHVQADVSASPLAPCLS